MGINTGEAVVAVGASPERGEGLVTGDVVNTANRIESVAPVNGVAVSEQTYRATSHIFEYEPLEPVSERGKPSRWCSGGRRRCASGSAPTSTST